jgi:hypothetical protein
MIRANNLYAEVYEMGVLAQLHGLMASSNFTLRAKAAELFCHCLNEASAEMTVAIVKEYKVIETLTALLESDNCEFIKTVIGTLCRLAGIFPAQDQIMTKALRDRIPIARLYEIIEECDLAAAHTSRVLLSFLGVD